MFSPPGYRPLSGLWDEFLHHRLDSIYRAVADFYAGPEFDGNAVRGTPLDICEYQFLRVMSNLNPVLASTDGHVMKIHDETNDGGDHLFALVPPYQSAGYVKALASQQGTPDELHHLGGEFF